MKNLLNQELPSHLFAAVDLGSNSFHLVVSRYEKGEFVVVDRYRESVRLAAGLDGKGNLSAEVRARAIACLEQISQRLESVPKNNVRVVGTNAMRRMREDPEFFNAAQIALGAEIEIISGREEARLIYLGVVNGSELGNDCRIVVDIGGGSTEVIVGVDDEPQHLKSLEIGCVVVSQKFFADGVLSSDRFAQAMRYCKSVIQSTKPSFSNQVGMRAIGCSGTIRALSGMLDVLGWTQGEITQIALAKLYEHVVDIGDVEKVKISGLNADRRPIFAGGLSILLTVFELFELERMQVSTYSLRDGVLYDLVGDV